MKLLWLFIMLVFGLGSSAVAADGVDQAEYNRLQQELEKLATRNAWSGVERTYQAMLETGATFSMADYVSGAHAARAVGNLTAARERLIRANELGEDREILDWLWEIDSQYGRVFLAADRGSKDASLQCPSMPFNPDQRRAVEYAQQRVEETGMFDGYLPQGKYVFGDSNDAERLNEVEVVPRVQSLRIDLRSRGQRGLSAKELRRIEKQQRKLMKEKH